MLSSDKSLRGVVHGKVIQLETEIGLPDGQEVTVTFFGQCLSSQIATLPRKISIKS